MSLQDIPPVPYKTPMTEGEGTPTQPWAAWFRQVLTRLNATAIVNPMTAVGDFIIGGASGALGRLAGNTTTTRKFMRQTGNGSSAASTGWDTLQAADIPTLNQSTTGNAATATAPAAGSAHGVATLDGSAHFQSVAPSTSGNVLRSNGTDWASSAIQAADVPTLNQSTTGTAALATAPAAGSAHGAVTLDGSSDFQTVAPGSSGNYMRSDGTDWASSAIQAGDVPTLNQNTSGTAAKATSPATGTGHGVVTLASGGAFQSVAPGASGGYLRSDGTDFVRSSIQAADVPTLNQNTSGSAATATTATAPATGSAHGAATLDGSGNFQSVAPGSAGGYLRSNGTDFVRSAIQSSDVPTLNQNTSGTSAGLSATLAIASGGTNSTASLSNNRVMKSSGGAIIEAAAITGNRLLVSDANGIPVASATTDTEAGYLTGLPSNVVALLKYLDKSKYSYIYDDFTGANGSAFGDSGWAAQNSGGSTGFAASEASHHGIYQHSTSSSASGRAGVGRITNSVRFGTDQHECRHIIRIPTLSTSAETFYCNVGWHDTAGSVDAVDGAWFQYQPTMTFTFTGTVTNGSANVSALTGFTGVIDATSIQPGMAITGTNIPANTTVLSVNPGANTMVMSANATPGSGAVTITATVGNFPMCKVSNNSSRSVQVLATALIANTWYEWYIIVNSAGNSVGFYVGVSGGAKALVATITTNIPTSAGRETGSLISITKTGTGTTARTIDNDLYEELVTFATARYA